MIKRLHVENFKCIKDQTLEILTPIVGIWGKNGSGKSSLLQAMLWALKTNWSGILGRSEDVTFSRDLTKYACSVEVIFSDGKQYKRKITGPETFSGGEDLQDIRYFPPWRRIGARTSRINIHVDSDLGFRGGDIHTFIHHFLHQLMGRLQRGDKEAGEIYDKLNTWAEKIGFGKLLDSPIGAEAVMGTYRDEILNLEVPVFDGGFGGNSFLPILLEGYSFKDGVMLIEEPEISLHPAAQSEVLDFFIEMARERNHQIIFTSHSEYMVKKIARLLKEGILDSNLISVYVARKEDESGTMFEKKNKEDLIDRYDRMQEIILELTKRT